MRAWDSWATVGVVILRICTHSLIEIDSTYYRRQVVIEVVQEVRCRETKI